MVFSISILSAQSVEELKAMVSDKQATLDGLQGEIDALTKQIDEFPGWKVGGVGTLGFDLLANNNWFAIGTPNSGSNALGVGLTGYANLDEDKYFWRNGLLVNVSSAITTTDRTIGETDPGAEGNTITALTNQLDVSSLFGYKLSPKLALSAEGKWTSSLLEFIENDPAQRRDDEYGFALNRPGVATVSAGVTWTPIANLVVIIHPLGYQQNWPGDLISSPGAKIGAAYAAEIIPGVSWTSNLSAFVPYSSGGTVEHALDADETAFSSVAYDGGELVNWEWINGFSTSIWKGIGVAFNLGLKGNKQQADAGRLLGSDGTVNISDNPLQSYYTLGLGYTF